MTFLERTTDVRRYRQWEGNMEADYIYTSGVAAERFFVTLRDEGRLLASRCKACGFDYLPPRLFCEECFGQLAEFVAIPSQGRVASLTVAHQDRTGERASPEAWAFVTFEGIRGGLVHRVLAPPEAVRLGARVRIKLRPRKSRTGTIADIEGFEPAGSAK